MVNVETKNLLDGQFTRLFKDLYIKTSAKPLPFELPYPIELKQYLDVLYGCVGAEYKLTDNKYMLKKKCQNADIHDTRCLCAFSGGKDSVANALLLRDIGYEPILFFVKGINRSYPQEYEISLELASELGMEMVTYNLKISGKCDFVENPTKDQFILALMVDYGVKYNIVNYSFGCCREDEVDGISTEYMLSDGYEMFKAIEKFYQHFVNGFNIANFLENETHSFYEVCNHDPHLLDKTYSCMTPLRYKLNIRNTNEQKYNVKLLPHRCGSCYKCCGEAITLNLFGVTNYPESFIEHCKEILDKTADEKFNATVRDTNKSGDTEWVSTEYILKYRKEHGLNVNEISGYR